MNTSLVTKIREAFPIAPFVSPYTGGLKPTKTTKFWVGYCPFCQTEHRGPHKFWVLPDKGICGCFKIKCQKRQPPMDVINFYARLHQVSNREAIRELANLIVRQKQSD